MTGAQMSNPPDRIVPKDWLRLVSLHHCARIDRAAMRSAATQQQRDLATTQFVQGVDGIMGLLAEMHDAGQLKRITQLLSQDVPK